MGNTISHSVNSGIEDYSCNGNIYSSNILFRNGAKGLKLLATSVSTPPHIENLTCTENEEEGILSALGSSVSGFYVVHSIFWNNNDGGVDMGGIGYGQYAYCDIGMGGSPGNGNISADPLFVDPEDEDFHILYTSPCRDAGNNSYVWDPDSEDFEHDPRIAWNGTVDMGADEFYTHLYYTGDATPLETIKVKIIGKASAEPVGLFIGSGVLPDPIEHRWGFFWLESPWFPIYLGTMPNEGVIRIPAQVPTSPPVPWDLPIQALIGKESDSLSNLCVIEVR